jgi:hypothetical protein
MSAPGAKMLAVVAQQAVSVLSQAGSRTLGNFDGRVERGGFELDRHSVPRGELLKRYFGYGPATEAIGQAHVMHDLAAADVDSVVGVSATRGDETVREKLAFDSRATLRAALAYRGSERKLPGLRVAFMSMLLRSCKSVDGKIELGPSIAVAPWG